MSPERFKHSLTGARPPADISVYLQALWQDYQGNWDQAHELIQDRNDRDAARIHAFLHRKEGDLFNADYWYRMASRKRPEHSLTQEWQELVNYFLEKENTG